MRPTHTLTVLAIPFALACGDSNDRIKAACDAYCGWAETCGLDDASASCVDDCVAEGEADAPDCVEPQAAALECFAEQSCPDDIGSTLMLLACVPDDAPDHCESDGCCDEGDPCGYADDGVCDCEDAAWDAADCAGPPDARIARLCVTRAGECYTLDLRIYNGGGAGYTRAALTYQIIYNGETQPLESDTEPTDIPSMGYLEYGGSPACLDGIRVESLYVESESSERLYSGYHVTDTALVRLDDADGTYCSHR